MFTVLLSIFICVICLLFSAPEKYALFPLVALGVLCGLVIAGIVSFFLERLASYTTTLRGTYLLQKFTHSVTGEQVFLEHYEGARTPPFWRYRYLGENGEEKHSVECGCSRVEYRDVKDAYVSIYEREIDPLWKSFVISFALGSELYEFSVPRGSAPDAESESLRLRKMGAVNP